MNKFSKPVCIAILACLLSIAILYAKAPNGPAESKPEVLVEATRVQINSEVLEMLGIDASAPGAEVTIPVAKLLWCMADPNAVKTIVSAKIKVWAGETGKFNTGQKIKYLVKTGEDSFEQRTTNTLIGTTFEATPIIDKDGNIILNFKFEHSSVAPLREIDPQTSLPIGKPIIGIESVNSRLKFKSGEPMIAGGSQKYVGNMRTQRLVLVRAEILGNKSIK